MTITSDVLNPLLYRRLLRRFGEVKIRNQGEARIARPDPLSDEQRVVVQQWGEQYYVRCPFCNDDCFQLGISYMYGQRDERSGRHLTYLAYCHANKCLARYENRVALAEMLSAHDGDLEEARILPGKRVSDDERIIELPTPLTRLDKLPPGHLARRYLDYRGFDPDKIGRYYGVSYCEGSQDPLARNRIVIPVHMRGKLRGWQSIPIDERAAGDDGSRRISFKYLSALGMNNSRLLYNFDKAPEFETGIVVKEPADVWSFGPMAVSLIGDSVSDVQQRLLRTIFRGRTLVLLFTAEEFRRPAIRKLVSALELSMSGRIARVELPHELPSGNEGRKALRAHVAKEAKAAGKRVVYAKCQ